MEIIKTSSMIKELSSVDRFKEYLTALDSDVANLTRLAQGRVRFGAGTDGAKGENVSGAFEVVTDTGSANTEFTVAHTLGVAPIGYLVTKINKAGVVYDSGTIWTSTNLYLKCSVANCAVTIFLIK
jgi:hypothetical protein